jgi:hypothetical protein
VPRYFLARPRRLFALRIAVKPGIGESVIYVPASSVLEGQGKDLAAACGLAVEGSDGSLWNVRGEVATLPRSRAPASTSTSTRALSPLAADRQDVFVLERLLRGCMPT